jgi:glycosyltransferase involved in cell wall biosynthesis
VSDDLVRWPRSSRDADAAVTIVTVNYNTREHVALLLWSVDRALRGQKLAIVVVDNGSVDGSQALLERCAEAGLCTLIVNDHNRYHGPALNQALSHLATRARQAPSEPVGWVWILDSDCVIVRPDTLSHAAEAASREGAALLGERRWDPWRRCDRLAPYSLFLDVAQVWQPEIAAFEDGGDPTYELERSCIIAKLPVVAFPFASESYVIHRGRSSLSSVRARDERTNHLYDWATTHHEPHFERIAGAAETYARLVDQFTADVPILDADHLVRACQSAT